MNDGVLKKLVFNALDSAVANGYSDLVRGDAAENVAVDLLDYDADIWEAVNKGEVSTPAVMDLIPFIEQWRRL